MAWLQKGSDVRVRLIKKCSLNLTDIRLLRTKCSIFGKGEMLFQTSPRGVFLSTSVIIAFNLDYLTKVDRIYRVQCFYMEMERRLEKEVLVKMPPPTLHTKQVPMPVCKYEVYRKWTCEAEQADTFCMVVHSCFVDDGNGERVQLINEKGCALDKYLLTNLEYPTDLMAGREAHVYKYADRDNMYFDCQITLRIKEPGSEFCEVPTCPDPPRRRRSHQAYPAITANEELRVDENTDFIIPHDEIVKLNWIQMNFDVRQAVLCMSNIGLCTVCFFNAVIIIISAVIVFFSVRLHALNTKLQC
ncbi:ZP domain-containing protein [Trichostrongylus colubriformis]|uniref:ZP domain-containing protein n=1 Tax=Trichostrongylus colubriformis TaxID=6319 RepID=A0AAN8F6S4_TRICO